MKGGYHTMIHKILKDLYYGQVRPFERPIPKRVEYTILSEEYKEQFEYF